MTDVYLNGEFFPSDQASVPINDRGFLFGDGVFTTIKVEEGKILNLSRHLKRLKLHCEHINILPPLILEGTLLELIARNNAQKGMWRMKIVVTGGSLTDLCLPPRQHGTVLITIKKVNETSLLPAHVVVYPYSIQTPISNIKSLSYLERLQVKQYAIEQGADDALVLLHDQFILETAFSNIFWIRGCDFFTPKSNSPLLRGVTLEKHIEDAKAAGMHVFEEDYTLNDIPDDAYVYLCNAMNEKRPVKSIVDREFLYPNKLKIWNFGFEKGP